MPRRTYSLLPALALAAGSLAAAPAAHADDVVHATLSLENGVVVYRATPGLVNDSYVNWGNALADKPPTFMGDDYWNHKVAIDPSCGPNPYINGYPACANGGMTPAIEVYLGDGDDAGHAGNSRGRGRVVTQFGEDGNDTLRGLETTDHLYGGPGHDRLEPDGSGALASTAVSAGDVVSGGDGVDTLKTHDYSAAGMRITLDGVADDGDLAPDGQTSVENDNYLPDIENVIGPTDSSAIVVATPAANSITTGRFDDHITPGAGADTVDAGAGHDTIDARDGEADRIDCGVGTDSVTADSIDTLIGCENVSLPPIQPPPPGGSASSLSVAKKKVRANKSRTKVVIPLACAGGTSRCAGKVRLVTGKGKKGKVMGKGSYDVAAGTSGRAVLRLTKRARAGLRKKARVRAMVICVPSSGTGATRKVVLARR